MNGKKTFLDYLTDIFAWALGGAMFIYLGYRTLDFLAFTFREEDVIFSYLGLFSTTVGAVIFALIWKRSFYWDARSGKWRSDEFRKAVSMMMMITCALGEVALAVADMSLVTELKSGVITLTAGELKTFQWLTAGLAALVGAAIAAIKLTPRHPKTDPEIDMTELDADNNGVLDRQQKPHSRPQEAPQANLRAAMAKEVKAEELDENSPLEGRERK